MSKSKTLLEHCIEQVIEYEKLKLKMDNIFFKALEKGPANIKPIIIPIKYKKT